MKINKIQCKDCIFGDNKICLLPVVILHKNTCTSKRNKNNYNTIKREL